MLVSSLWLGRGRSGTPIGGKLKKTFQAVDNCLFALFFYPWLSTSMEAQNLRCRCPRHTLFVGASTAVKGDVTELRGNEMSPNHVTKLLLCSKLLFLNRLEINDPTSLPRTGNAGEIGHRRRCGLQQGKKRCAPQWWKEFFRRWSACAWFVWEPARSGRGCLGSLVWRCGPEGAALVPGPWA